MCSLEGGGEKGVCRGRCLWFESLGGGGVCLLYNTFNAWETPSPSPPPDLSPFFSQHHSWDANGAGVSFISQTYPFSPLFTTKRFSTFIRHPRRWILQKGFSMRCLKGFGVGAERGKGERQKRRGGDESSGGVGGRVKKGCRGKGGSFI